MSNPEGFGGEESFDAQIERLRVLSLDEVINLIAEHATKFEEVQTRYPRKLGVTPQSLGPDDLSALSNAFSDLSLLGMFNESVQSQVLAAGPGTDMDTLAHIQIQKLTWTIAGFMSMFENTGISIVIPINICQN